jgi:hypothetical protein
MGDANARVVKAFNYIDWDWGKYPQVRRGDVQVR